VGDPLVHAVHGRVGIHRKHWVLRRYCFALYTRLERIFSPKQTFSRGIPHDNRFVTIVEAKGVIEA
jgi:hypothetical protein